MKKEKDVVLLNLDYSASISTFKAWLAAAGKGSKAVGIWVPGDHRIYVSQTAEHALPPRAGEALLLLFCRHDLADAIAGDLEEKFDKDCISAGRRRAVFRYWIRVIRSAGPLIFARLRNWGLFAAAVVYGRRKIGL